MARRLGPLFRRLAGRVEEAAEDRSPAVGAPAEVAVAQLPGEAAVAPSSAEEQGAPGAPPPARLVDATTRTFWQRGARATETLVESDGAGGGTVAHRVRDLAAESVGVRRRPGAPTAGPGSPAFTELALVEFLRERRFDRAFALLSPSSRAAWGDVDRFAAAQSAVAARLVGAQVVSMRRLAGWDDGLGTVHGSAVELTVEYGLATADRIHVVPRTVHLVRAEGGWRSVLPPPS